MMSSFFAKVMALFIAINLVVAPCYAGEEMSAGEILAEDSYVFTLEEAQNLRIRIKELEEEVGRQEELVEEFRRLDLVHQTKENEFEKILQSEQEQKLLYKDLYTLSYNRVRELEQRNALENIGMVSVGVAAAIGLILVADAVDDHIDKTGPVLLENSTPKMRHKLIKIKFR
jgi:hypothetical protein